jgi:hypothetical protein
MPTKIVPSIAATPLATHAIGPDASGPLNPILAKTQILIANKNS